jgi:hypothetical protein
VCETAEHHGRLRGCRRQRGQSREWVEGLRLQGSRGKARLYGLRRKVEVDADRLQEQKRRREQHRTRDREPRIVAVVTEETSHVIPIGA